jgi:hypothetical protein
MSGGGLAGPNPNKIKGGKWTVVRFFLCSVSRRPAQRPTRPEPVPAVATLFTARSCCCCLVPLRAARVGSAAPTLPRLQVGYSIAWMTLSSLLNDYSDLYGPSRCARPAVDLAASRRGPCRERRPGAVRARALTGAERTQPAADEHSVLPAVHPAARGEQLLRRVARRALWCAPGLAPGIGVHRCLPAGSGS